MFIQKIMEVNEEKFKETRKKAKEFYGSLSKIYCPYLGEDVNFNSEGFEHILFKSWNRGRSEIEQYTRLRLLPKAVEVIEKSHTLQEYNEENMFVRQKINSRWERRRKLVKYYVFIALFPDKGIRFKVICKQIEGGKPFFWSVYPSWRKKKNILRQEKKIFYTGNLEKD